MTILMHMRSECCSSVPHTYWKISEMNNSINKDKKWKLTNLKRDPKLSCVKMCILIQSFEHRWTDPFLRLQFLFKAVSFKMCALQWIISPGAEMGI
jgi:hypothetical protein